MNRLPRVTISFCLRRISSRLPSILEIWKALDLRKASALRSSLFVVRGSRPSASSDLRRRLTLGSSILSISRRLVNPLLSAHHHHSAAPPNGARTAHQGQ